MAEAVIKYILEAVDNVSGKLEGVKGSIDGLDSKTKTALAGIGAASTAFLALSIKAAADEEAAITKAARAVEGSAGGYDKARASLVELNTAMEKQGFSSEESMQATTLLVNKMGYDFPTALKKSADLMAYAENNNLSLESAVKRLTMEEKKGKDAMDGAASARMANLTTSDRLAIAQERLGNMMERMGEKLMPLVELAVSFGTKLLDAFDTLDPSIQSILLTVGAVVAVFLSLVGVIAAVLGPLAPLIAAFGVIAGWIGTIIGFAAPILAVVASIITGIGPLILIILAIIAAIVLVKAAFDGDFMGIKTTITNFVTGVVSAITGFVTDFTDKIVSFITDINKKWEEWTTGLVTAIATLAINIVKEMAEVATKLTTAFVDLIKKGAQWGAELVSAILQGIKDKAADLAKEATSAAGNAVKGILGGAAGLTASGVRPLGLAEGGIITRPTLAILGEGGENEHVIPESKLKAATGARGGPVTITFNITEARDSRQTALEINKALIGIFGASNTNPSTTSVIL